MRAMGRKRILCVDDSDLILLMERLVLAREGYELVTASDGEQALALAGENRPDLILLDVIMPRMSGLETCRRLRADARTRSVPIIMLSTRADEEEVAAAYQSGCTDYITKPIDGSLLLAKVKQALGDAS
jgi:two-component system, OmpR family, alkaline phosphatase synthesis response regulator PhoP